MSTSVATATIQKLTFPCTVWMVDSGGYPDKFRLIGETSRSWLSSVSPWGKQYKWSKKDYRVISKEEADQLIWCYEHRYKIAKAIDWNRKLTYEQLKQVAAIIGYEEEPTRGKG